MARWKPRLPRWLIWTGTPTLILLLAAAGGLGYLRSPAGGRLLGHELARALGSATQSEVTVTAVTGALPFAIEVSQATFAAEGRSWATIERLAIAWDPWALFAGRLRVNAITADAVTLAGLPPPGPPPEPTPGPPSLAIELPKLPLAVTVETLRVDKISLGPEIAGEPVELRLDGHARIGSELAAAELKLDAARVDGRAGSVRLSLGRAEESPDLSLRLAVEEPEGGLIARTLDLPGLPAVKLTLAGDGPVSDWKGRLDAKAGEAVVGADLGLGLGDTGRFRLQGTADLRSLLDRDTARLVPESLAVAAALEWQPGRRLSIDSLSFTSPEAQVSVQGVGDLAKNAVEGKLSLQVGDPKRWAKLMAPVSLTGLSLDARVEGPLNRPGFTVEAKADRLAVDPAAADRAAVRLMGTLVLDKEWRPSEVTLSGETRLDGLAAPGRPDLAAALGPAVSVGLDGAMQLMSGNATIRRLEVNARPGRMLVEGTVGGFGKTAKLSSRLTLADLSALAALAGVPLQGKGDLSLSVAGDLTRPMVDLGLDAKLAEVASSDPQIAALLGPMPSLTATAAVSAGAIELRPLKLEGAGIALGVTGKADLASRAVDAKAEGRIAELKPLSGLIGMGVKGSLAFDARAVGDAGQGGIRATATAKLDGFAIDQEIAKGLLGEQVSLDLAAVLAGDTLKVEKATLDGADLTVSASGRALPTLDLAVTAALPRLATLGPALGTRLDGPAKLEALLTGTPEQPAVEADVTAGPLTVEGTAIKRLRARATAKDLTGAPLGKLRLETEVAGTNGAIAGEYRLNGNGSLALDRLKLTLPETELAGDLVVLPAGMVQGKLAGTIGSLAPWGKLAGLALGGAVKLDIALKAEGGSQSVDARIDGRNLALDPGGPSSVAVEKLTATARLAGVLRTPNAAIDLKAERVATSDLNLANASVTANGTLAALKVTADLDGTYRRPLSLSTAGVVDLDGAVTKLRLDRLTAKHGALAARLAAPATLSYGASEIAVAGLDLRLGDAKRGGKITGDGRIGSKAVGLKLAVRDLPLALFKDLAPTADLDGTAAADLVLEGSPARPAARAELRLRGVRDKGSAAKSLPAIDGTATLALRDGRATLAARLGGPKELALEAQAELPASLSVSPVAFNLPQDGQLTGTVKGRLDLGLVPRLVDLRGDRLAGSLDVDMTLAGTLAAPRISGETRIANGSYRNAEAGTIVRDLALSVSGDAERIVLRSLTANDGEGGKVSASATIGLNGTELGGVKGEIKLERFAVLRRDDATARLSGNLGLDRGGEGTRVQGTLTVDSAEIMIPERLPPQIVKLDVKEVNLRAGQKAPPPPPKEPAVDLPIKLKITVAIPGRAFVRGRGIDSEWRGDLAIGGTAAAPDLIGDLQVIRGTVDAVGNVFKVTGGTITFVGGGDIDPELDLTAVAETKDVTAKIHVTGRASAPKIELGSDSGLPQEEVMSRLLFGKSAGGLSPTQGLALAQALAGLAGGGGGGSVLDDIRRGVGLDVLRVQSGENTSDSSVQAGKYLSDDVFLKVEQGLTPESRRVGVEVRVLPRVTVEGDVGAEGGSRVGVKWRYDY